MALGGKKLIMSLVFVYGSLRKGGINHSCLAGQNLVGEAESDETFLLKEWKDAQEDIIYPMDVRDDSPEAQPLQGEIYVVDDNTLSALDDFELYPDVYDRHEYGFSLKDGKHVAAFLYCAPPAVRP